MWCNSCFETWVNAAGIWKSVETLSAACQLLPFRIVLTVLTSRDIWRTSGSIFYKISNNHGIAEILIEHVDAREAEKSSPGRRRWGNRRFNCKRSAPTVLDLVFFVHYYTDTANSFALHCNIHYIQVLNLFHFLAHTTGMHYILVFTTLFYVPSSLQNIILRYFSALRSRAVQKLLRSLVIS